MYFCLSCRIRACSLELFSNSRFRCFSRLIVDFSPSPKPFRLFSYCLTALAAFRVASDICFWEDAASERTRCCLVNALLCSVRALFKRVCMSRRSLSPTPALFTALCNSSYLRTPRSRLRSRFARAFASLVACLSDPSPFFTVS